MNAALSQANLRVVRWLLLVVVGMFAFGYAMVPLYYSFCDYTGINKGDEQILASKARVVDGRSVLIQFDANAAAPFRFHPLTLAKRVHPGALVQVEYEIENLSGEAVLGQAVPSYGPQSAGAYFKKIECFCFRQQLLQAHEKRRMPVLFLLDDKLPKDIGTVTLSYTFFRRGPA